MWRRALAFLIDLIPIIVFLAIIEAAMSVIENLTGVTENGLIDVTTSYANLLSLFVYFVGMNYQFGGTLGKRMVGLRVAVMPSSTNVLGQLFIRAFVKIICFFYPLTVVYGCISIWRPDGRSLADFAAKTSVIDANSLTPPKQASDAGRVLASLLLAFAPWIFMVIIFIVWMNWSLVANWKEIIPSLKFLIEIIENNFINHQASDWEIVNPGLL